MKKFISLMLCICLAFVFVGCSSKNESDDTKTLDLKYYAELGQIPEAEYTLGADVDTIVKEQTAKMEEMDKNHGEDPNHEHGHEEEMFYFDRVEGEKNVLLDNGNICYYYNKANKEKGVSYIVSYSDAFGIKLGTLITEVKEMCADVEFKEETLNEENAFFATQGFDGTVLSADFDGTVILFVFQENALSATAIYNANWNN